MSSRPSRTHVADVELTTEASEPPTKIESPRSSARLMTRAELSGRHEYATQNGPKVQIWFRDGKYLARARWNGKQIGATLGSDASTAEHELRRLLTRLEDGTFVSGTQARRQRFGTRPVPQLSLRCLVNLFLDDRQRLSGKETSRAYGDRLMHALDFAELAKSKKSWPLAASINRQFAVEFKNFLFERHVSRNGKDGGIKKAMAPKMARLCLEALRTALNWAARADVRQLPAGFVNPITPEILGPNPVKDPLRTNPVPLDDRVRMVHQMDAWQLCCVAPLLILPLRFEDLSGAIISDFDLEQGGWRLGTRLQGNDFNKGRMNLCMPLPQELCGILRRTVSGRSDGPMFRSRRNWMNGKRRRLSFETLEGFADLCETAIRQAPKGSAATEQDRKVIVRKLLQNCGAVSTDAVAREIRHLYDAAGIGRQIRPYDLRSAVTNDMKQAGIAHLELRYLTEHSVNDILNEYTGLDPVGQMAKYFNFIAPLRDAMRQRAADLGNGL